MLTKDVRTLRNKIIGVLLRDARLRAGKTLQDCAAVLDCSPGTITQFELGRKPLSPPIRGTGLLPGRAALLFSRR